MRILITNDDSISASQLLPLIRWCKKLGQVTTVVPAVEQSGKSHGIQIMNPFRAKKQMLEDEEVWAVESSPADCVRFAVMGLKQDFDLVVSGVNRGCNMGLDVMYSGTVAAIYEAAALGIPAVAFSSPFQGYETVISRLDEVWAYFEENKLFQKHSLYNVNIPPEPKGICITHQGGPYYTDDFDPREDDFYMPIGRCVHENKGDLSIDTDCVISGYTSITPMTLERTDWQVYKLLRNE
ncbi:MAG: 5'/3'-nucleotidase SurE [Oscillospiraceae bacterium]|nr:5'/3'-nucleotidase SurE [Oscillospiraceae bacterium]